jgi:uncharacterized protein (TIGR02246 family)
MPRILAAAAALVVILGFLFVFATRQVQSNDAGDSEMPTRRSFVDDEQAIRDWFETWKAATESGDLDAVLDLYAEDAVFLLPGGETMERGPFAEGVTNSPEKERDYLFEGGDEIVEVRVFGDHAYLWTKSEFKITVKAENQTTSYRGHGLAILEKRNGKWVAIRDVNNVVPESDGGE